MNRLVRGSLVLVIVVAVAASTARADVPDEWKSLDVAGLIKLAQQLLAKGDAGAEDRGRLAAYVAERYFKDKAATRSVTVSQWYDLARCLAGDLSDETRAAWASNLCKAFADSPEALNGLKYGEVVSLHGAVSALDAAKSTEMTITLVNETTAWKSWKPTEVFSIAGGLARTGDAGKAARQRFVGHVADTYLANAEATRSVTVWHWHDLVRYLAGDLSDEIRATWAGKLRTAFAGSPDALGGLKAWEIVRLVQVVDALDATKHSEMVVITLVNETAAWKSWKPGRVSWLALRLTWTGEQGKAARQKLAAYVTAEYFKDKAATQSIPCRYWLNFANYLGKDLSADDRRLWAGKLRDAFTDSPKTLADLKASEFKYLAEAVVSLDAGQAATMVLAWFKVNESKGLDSASAGDLTRIALAGRADKAGMAPVMDRLETLWLEKNKQAPLKLNHSVLIVRAWLAMGNQAKAQQWMMRAYETALGTEQARASADAVTLRILGMWLRDTGLTSKGKGYPEFAAVLARLAREGKLPAEVWWRYEYYAAPLGTAETRQTVQAKLTDAAGNPRPVVATILSWAYRDAEDRKDWLAVLDEKLAAADGEAKVRWMLARAWAESLVPGKAEPQRLRGKQWLEQVLDVAKSASLRIAAIEQLALGYATANEYTEGAVFLNSAAKRFTDEQTAVAIKALCAEHIASEVKYLTEQIAMFRKFANQMDKAVQEGNEARKEFFLKWAENFRQREKDLLGRLEQIEQSN